MTQNKHKKRALNKMPWDTKDKKPCLMPNKNAFSILMNIKMNATALKLFLASLVDENIPWPEFICQIKPSIWAFLHKNHWKSKVQPASEVCSTQMLVEIYKKCGLVQLLRLQKVPKLISSKFAEMFLPQKQLFKSGLSLIRGSTGSPVRGNEGTITSFNQKRSCDPQRFLTISDWYKRLEHLQIALA